MSHVTQLKAEPGGAPAPKPLEAPSPVIGRIVAVTGAQAVVTLDKEVTDVATKMNGPQIGSVLTVKTAGSVVVGIISGLAIPAPAEGPDDPEHHIVEIELIGEIVETSDAAGDPVFRQGISSYPSLGDPVRVASRHDLQIVFAPGVESSFKIGTLHQDANVAAHVITDDLLSKHFAVLGSTGTGKSCAVALILRRILEHHKHAHIVVLDTHNEYGGAFADLAEVITPDTMQLPFWMLTFDELIDVVFPDQAGRLVEIELLRDMIPAAKRQYSSSDSDRPRLARLKEAETEPTGPTVQYSVDTPLPYKIADLTKMLDDQMGRLERTYDLTPYKRLKARLQALSSDPSYAFMFGSLTVSDVMKDVVSRIFRVPTHGKPMSILDLSCVPADVMNSLVSVVCRLAFEIALWSDRSIPITLVCEEAHRYIPREEGHDFAPATRSISRIAREGRKYGVSLCVVSQRPAELASTILSQSSTVFALRLTNKVDQDIVRAAVSDASASLFGFLPSLGNGEAIAIGEGVGVPMRITFDRLNPEDVPRSHDAAFAKLWSTPSGDIDDLSSVIARWRAQKH